MAKKIAFDYESIKQRIIQNLSSQSEWANFLNFGVIDNIISSITNEMSYQIQYSEYNTMENFWNLARNKSSLLQMAPMHGYVVPRKISSVGTVRVSTSKTFNSSYPKSIAIPKFFEFSGNKFYVVASNDSVLDSNQNYIDITCNQGEAKEISFLAEGKRYEEKTIYDDSIDNSFFVLTVNGVEWKCVDTLFAYSVDKVKEESELQVYQIRTLPNFKGITIEFGNDVFGKKLQKNDQIVFKYITTKGSEGNIFSANIINSVKSQAFDSSGESVKLYCTNVSTFVGGHDYPSIDEIRDMSPKVYQSGDRASSKTDYETILEEISYLGKISVWGAYEYLKDTDQDPWGFIPSTENVIHFALLDSNYDELNDDRKNEIIEKIHEICNPTDLFSFEKPNKIPLIFHINGTMSSLSYTTAEIENNIKNALSETYGIEKMNFGDSIYDSDYVRLIDEVQGIDNHISYIELYKEDRILTSAYYGNFKLPIYPIDYSSVVIYIKDTSNPNSEYEELATCDANGNIVGSGIYITTDSELNLNDGNGTLIIKNGLTSEYTDYIFKINYRHIGKNLINSNRANLLYYDDAIVELNFKPRG